MTDDFGLDAWPANVSIGQVWWRDKDGTVHYVGVFPSDLEPEAWDRIRQLEAVAEALASGDAPTLLEHGSMEHVRVALAALDGDARD